MEFVEARALKTSFRPEMSLKTNQQVVFEDVWVGNGTTNGGVLGGGDETFVDDFLDFSNEDVENEQGFVEEDEDIEKDSCSQKQDTPSNSNGVSGKNELGSVLGSELSVPTDDLADLEWLSHFVEDSFSDFSLQHLERNPSKKTENAHLNRAEPEEGGTPLLKPMDFPITIPAKARSKRSRAVRVWCIGGGSSSLTETSSSSTSTSSTSSSSSSCLIFNSSGSQNLEYFDYLGKPPANKKQKKRKHGSVSGGTQLQRRCSHCGVQKTPQWRAGPNGAKTLCNACGVRYKSGRLLPEYRPACSPTFSSEVHSNSHRKVLEMRKKKEVGPPDSGFAPAVHSF